MMLDPKKGKTVPFLLLITLIGACCFWILPEKKIGRPLVYDCFLFYNELELLEIRLHEMASKVDKFVLVECSETFRGKPKKLFFAENKELFAKFADKIIHVAVTEPFKTEDPWEREHFQRNQILRGLKQAKPNDIIILSDVDEIVREQSLNEIISALDTKKADLVVCQQKLYSGYLNRTHAKDNIWQGTTALCYKNLKRLSPTKVRKLRKMRKRHLRKNKIQKPLLLAATGWHFTSLGGIDRYITKIESFSHSELDTKENKDPAHVAKVLKSYPVASIDESFPKFVRENQEELQRKGLIDRN
jgi:beta-1,4-mannosyl-glycoprotein beta-1,4-N-acetylglucosaminyltransferase